MLQGEQRSGRHALARKRFKPQTYTLTRAVAESAAWRIEDTTESSSPQLSLPKQGTYRLLCVQYFSSADFRRLDPRTQRVRRSILESTFNEPIAPGKLETFADFPLTRLTGKGIRVLRDRKADFPQAANARVKAVRQVFAWAIEQERVSANPARDVSYVRSTSDGFHSWNVDEVERFERCHPIGTKAQFWTPCFRCTLVCAVLTSFA